MTIEKDKAQVFCSCGHPIETWNVPEGSVALPIEWIENGCQKCRFKKMTEEHRASKNSSMTKGNIKDR